MAPHLHHVPQGSSKSTGGKAIKDEHSEISNSVLPSKSTGGTGQATMNENKEKSMEVFTGSTHHHNPTIQVHVHPEDIASFAQFGFNEHAKQLANQTGFQAAVIEGVAAMECAKVEIEGQEMEDLYENMWATGICVSELCKRK